VEQVVDYRKRRAEQAPLHVDGAVVEQVVDYRKRRRAPLHVDGAVVEQVESFMFIGVRTHHQ
jgi:hypothetical protein